jgi:hypothetical protein
MWRLLFCAAFILPFVAGCDDGPGARRHLAQCQLNPHAKQETGGWDDDYLSTCMQAGGYVIDLHLPMAGDVKCGELPYPAIDAECYRPDNALAQWYVEASSPERPK